MSLIFSLLVYFLLQLSKAVLNVLICLTHNYYYYCRYGYLCNSFRCLVFITVGCYSFSPKIYLLTKFIFNKLTPWITVCSGVNLVTGEYSISFSEWFTRTLISTLSFCFHWFFVFAWFISWIFNIIIFAHIEKSIQYNRNGVYKVVLHNII